MQQHDNINWLCPVNWDHPLNRRLVSWYLAMPNQPGWKSSQWLDLTDPLYGHHGTLTGMSPETSWTSADRGRHSLAFDGLDDGVVLSGIPSLLPPVSLTLWFKPANTLGGVRRLVAFSEPGNQFILTAYQSGTTVVGQYTNPNNNTSTASGITTEWQHLAVVIKNSASIITYINGVPATEGTFDAGTLLDAASGTIGRWSLAAIQFFNGHMNDIRIYQRSLTFSEIQDLYIQSLIENPSLLNLVGLRSFRISAGSPWYYNLQQGVAA